jgi:hypothetical protein
MFEFFALMLAAGILVVSLYALHKIRNMHLMMYAMKDQVQAESASLFRQLEALHGLYIDLGFKRSLPATRGWAASPDFLLELSRYALDHKPKTVVECSSGTSTLILARCMQINGGGKVYSLEHDPVYAQATREELERHCLAEFAQVFDAPLREVDLEDASWVWYGHEVLPAGLEIDMLAIDGPPLSVGANARYPAGPVLFPKLSSKGTVFLDDAQRASETAALARWKKEFPWLEQGVRYCEKGCAVLRANRPAAVAQA